MRSDVVCLSSAFDHTADGGATLGGDAEEVGARGEVGEVDTAGAFGTANTAACGLVDVHTEDVVGLDGDDTRGGIGIEVERHERVGCIDANRIDDEHEDDDAVAACLSAAYVEVLSALGVGGTVPSIAVGGGVVEGVADAIVDGEVEGDDAVAALGIESGVRIDRGDRVD